MNQGKVDVVDQTERVDDEVEIEVLEKPKSTAQRMCLKCGAYYALNLTVSGWVPERDNCLLCGERLPGNMVAV